MIQPPLSLSEVNALDRAAFVARLGHLFEASPWIAERAWDSRPFADLRQLHSSLCQVMYAAPVERQVALIAAHPDLVGRAALAGILTPTSAGEQAAAGLDRLSPAEIAEFSRLNARYRERFDFPFVICARENRRETILAGFRARMTNTRDQEIATALDEIAKIAWLRLCDSVQHDQA